MPSRPLCSMSSRSCFSVTPYWAGRPSIVAMAVRLRFGYHAEQLTARNRSPQESREKRYRRSRGPSDSRQTRMLGAFAFLSPFRRRSVEEKKKKHEINTVVVFIRRKNACSIVSIFSRPRRRY